MSLLVWPLTSTSAALLQRIEPRTPAPAPAPSR